MVILTANQPHLYYYHTIMNDTTVDTVFMVVSWENTVKNLIDMVRLLGKYLINYTV